LGPSFLKEEGSPRRGSAYIEKFASRFEFGDVRPPALCDLVLFLAAAPDRAPGPDGIPYAGWKFAGPVGAETFPAASGWLQEGGLLGFWFNSAAKAFIPKKPKAGDEEEVVRDHDDVQTLGCKDCANKTIGGVSARLLRRSVSQSLCGLQRGFVHGRNFCDDVVSLDSAGRICGRSELARVPVLATFDYGTAFPSLSQDFMFQTLRAANFLCGFLNLCVLLDCVCCRS